jgi:hypothetical protein
MFRRILLFIAICIVLFAGAVILAITGDTSRNNHGGITLNGLKGVCIVIEKIDLQAALDGLEAGRVRRTVEKTLQKSGIPVLSESQMLEKPGAPYLYFVINTAKDERALLYAYHVRAELRQSVRMDRDQKIISTAATWQSSEPVGIIGIDKIDLLPAAVEKCATEFAIAYLKANKR